MISQGRAIGGTLGLCALALCAFGAVGASASLTAVTCEEKGAGSKYSSSSCQTPQSSGNYETAQTPLNTTTEVTANATEEEPALRATLGGAATTVKCTTSELVGTTVTNREPAAGKMTIESTVTRNTYTGCKAMLKSNEARFCLVEEVTGPNPGTLGMISTNPLKGTTTGVNHQVKVEPAAAGPFTKFTILNKAKGGFECPFNVDVSVEVTGSIEGEVNTTNHAHLTFTEANNGTAIKANGGSVKYLDTVGGTMKATTTVVGAETFGSTEGEEGC